MDCDYTPPDAGAVDAEFGTETYTPPDAGAVDSEFCDLGSPARWLSVLPAPRGRFRLRTAKRARFEVHLPPPGGRIRAQYDVNVFDVLPGGATDRWRRAVRLTPAASAPWRVSQPNHTGAALPWRQAANLKRDSSVRWKTLPAFGAATAERWRQAGALGRGISAPWIRLGRADHAAAMPWQQGRLIGAGVDTLWQVLPRVLRVFDAPWSIGALLATGLNSDYQQGARANAGFGVPWDIAALLAGRPFPYVQIPEPEPEPEELCLPLPGTAPLVFYALQTALAAGSAPLIFSRFLCAHLQPFDPVYVIPIRRVYIMLNSAVMTRLPGLEPIPIKDVSVSIDFSSYTWNISATALGAAAWDAVQPDPFPVEVSIDINGYPWRAVVDTSQKTEAFGAKLAFRINARGWAARYFGEPYIETRQFTQSNARTMNQLAAEILQGSGWSLNWQAVDWLIPGGVWSHTGTPMAALMRLADAAGSHVQADSSAATLAVKKRYPVLPWHYYDPGTAVDVDIPANVMLSLGRAPFRGPGYNGVYVRGEDAGVIAHVRRTGTQGDVLATMITDALMTDVIGARARGEVALADAVDGAQVGLSLPLSQAADPEVPLIRVGQLVSVGADRGVVNAVAIRAQAASGGGLVVRQEIGLEVKRNGG